MEERFSLRDRPYGLVSDGLFISWFHSKPPIARRLGSTPCLRGQDAIAPKGIYRDRGTIFICRAQERCSHAILRSSLFQQVLSVGISVANCKRGNMPRARA